MSGLKKRAAGPTENREIFRVVGSRLLAIVQAIDGNLYGTTKAGGAYGDGTIFKITRGGTLTTLYSFNGTDGYHPLVGLVQATDGNLYGTTVLGRAYGDGTIFKITPGGTLTTLHSFNGTDGADPYGPLVHISGFQQVVEGSYSFFRIGAYDQSRKHGLGIQETRSARSSRTQAPSCTTQ